MPNYSSPITSPKRRDIKNFLYSNTDVVKKWKPESEPIEQCTICLENISSEFRLLKCKHKFHKNCIEKWFEAKDTCPVCRDPQERDAGISDLYSEYGLQSSLSSLPSLSDHILRGYRRRERERRSRYTISGSFPNYAHK